MQVFETFHTDRQEYDRRLSIGNRMIQQWRSRGAPTDEGTALVDWFTRASAVSKPGAVGRLPDSNVSPPHETSPDALPVPRQNRKPRRRPRTAQQPDRRRRIDAAPIAPSDPTLAPKQKSDWTFTRIPQMLPSQELPPLTSELELATPRLSGIAPQRTNAPAPHAAPPTANSSAVELPHRRVDESLERTTVGLLPKRMTQRLPVPGPSPQRHGAPAPDVTGESPDFDLWSPASAASIQVEPSPAPASNVTMATPSSESPIDLSVLAARIRSSNLRLSEIESELARNGLWDSKRLRPLVDRFEQMLSGRRLSELYYGALNRVERQRVAPFSPVRPTMTMLSQRLFEARVAATEDTVFFPPDSDEVNELQTLAQTVESWKHNIHERDD